MCYVEQRGHTTDVLCDFGKSSPFSNLNGVKRYVTDGAIAYKMQRNGISLSSCG